MPLRRLLPLLLAVALLAACQADPGSAPGDAPADPAAPAAPGAPDGDPAPAEPSQAADPAPGAPATPAGPALPADTAGLGAMCRHYLRPEPSRLVIEVDWQAGAEASSDALEHLRGVLASVADKPGGVDFAGHSELPGGDPDQVWTAEQLRALAAEHRSQHSSSEQTAMYVLFVRGAFQDSGAIGVAYNATEFAVFPDRMRDVTTALLGGGTAVERAVLVHEAGHLLCLVNIGFQSELGREDAEHPGHSSDRASVMHWAIDTSAVGQVFNGPPPDDFTAQDREDLDGLRSGRY